MMYLCVMLYTYWTTLGEGFDLGGFYIDFGGIFYVFVGFQNRNRFISST